MGSRRRPLAGYENRGIDGNDIPKAGEPQKIKTENWVNTLGEKKIMLISQKYCKKQLNVLFFYSDFKYS